MKYVVSIFIMKFNEIIDLNIKKVVLFLIFLLLTKLLSQEIAISDLPEKTRSELLLPVIRIPHHGMVHNRPKKKSLWMKNFNFTFIFGIL